MSHPYRVPLYLDRSLGPSAFRLVNTSEETLRGVTVLLDGPGVMTALRPITLAPGVHVDISVRGHDLALRTSLVVRWLRLNGDEYLWRASF